MELKSTPTLMETDNTKVKEYFIEFSILKFMDPYVAQNINMFFKHS